MSNFIHLDESEILLLSKALMAYHSQKLMHPIVPNIIALLRRVSKLAGAEVTLTIEVTNE